MAKNIYRKYRAVETFEWRDIFRDINYDFENDPSYSVEDIEKIKCALPSSGSVSFSYGTEQYKRVGTEYKVNISNKSLEITESEVVPVYSRTKRAYLLFDLVTASYGKRDLESKYKKEPGYKGLSKRLLVFDTTEDKIDADIGFIFARSFLGIQEYTQVSTGFEKGEYLGEVEAEAGTYPLEQNYNGYWYEYDRPANYPPKISGSDYDMGSKTENFDIEYYVTDQNNESINAKILLDDIQKETKSVFNNQKNTYTVNIKNLNLGSHTVKIIATDSFGATDTRIYTFYKSNVAPKISGQDKDLGGKSLGFTITYDVTDSDGDEVDVTITLNNEELSNISTTSKNGLTFTLDDEKVKKLTIGDVYTITIKADDRKGGIAYRRYTFTKTNSVPVISGNDKDLGEKSEVFSHIFSVTDYEKDPISFVVKLDGKVIKEVEEVEDGQDYQIDITQEEFMKLSYGKHTIKIEAWDSINADKIQKRELTFTRVSNGLDVEIKVATSKVQPKKIIAVPHGIFAPDATLQVLVCNNYLDAEPTWEDSTSMSKIARAYAFTNDVKEGDQWAIGIKIVVENGESGEVSILKGVKGGFE